MLCNSHILLVGRWGDMYCSQSIIQPLHQAQPKASLVDNMVNLKGETGVVGFVYYTSVHSFLGVILTYKTNWFIADDGSDKEVIGRIDWQCYEALDDNWCFRDGTSLGSFHAFDNGPWIAIWFITIHAVAFGAMFWYTLINPMHHKGQLSIMSVLSIFPACILLVHHLSWPCFEQRRFALVTISGSILSWRLRLTTTTCW